MSRKLKAESHEVFVKLNQEIRTRTGTGLSLGAPTGATEASLPATRGTLSFRKPKF
jgi:hypothetical protein